MRPSLSDEEIHRCVKDVDKNEPDRSTMSSSEICSAVTAASKKIRDRSRRHQSWQRGQPYICHSGRLLDGSYDDENNEEYNRIFGGTENPFYKRTLGGTENPFCKRILGGTENPFCSSFAALEQPLNTTARQYWKSLKILNIYQDVK